jgi:Leucine-rich repeat (LRR) protein
MSRPLIVIGFVAFSIQASAQQFLVFKNRKDSIQYEKASNLLWVRQPNSTISITNSNVNIDSLNSVLERLRKKALGSGQYYNPKRNFISYTDLKAGKVHPDTIRQLSISDLKSTEVPNEVLACKNLEELELVNTKIDRLQAELNSLQKLTSVYLFNNNPSKRLVLEQNTHINYLRIAGHNPKKLPKTYKNFTSLDSLNVNRSMSDRIPNVKKNRELKIINAVGNNITLKGYKKSSSLERLDLRANKITVVPNSIGRKYKSLKALSFNANPVRKVKPGLGKLANLEYLSFYANGITEIPAPVYKLTKLQVIDLFDNRIESVSSEIKNLQQLKVLYLANNRLYRLPDEIGQLKNLEEVYVYNNRMDTLPASMDNLENLRVLWVNDNFFHTVPATTWRVKNIDYLDVSQNFIKRVPDEITQAGNLSVLILSGTLMNKERDNPELFQKLREKGTRIIYYRSGTEVEEEEREF